ncbi:hypothetical protein ELI17_37360 [Rhizobium ruizarguesonis]|uniref:hypothetical protein n=1 Tax=Rhizobium ruizarguesonis TaxID=2081791 RepID=UPI00102F7901|nr:hypothetical protein [Rhizobium ruizarguesonis]TAW39042.1 hypothetical protein ELI17_37360 [Rhizobium ruizarguesonis]
MKSPRGKLLDPTAKPRNEGAGDYLFLEPEKNSPCAISVASIPISSGTLSYSAVKDYRIVLRGIVNFETCDADSMKARLKPAQMTAAERRTENSDAVAIVVSNPKEFSTFHSKLLKVAMSGDSGSVPPPAGCIPTDSSQTGDNGRELTKYPAPKKKRQCELTPKISLSPSDKFTVTLSLKCEGLPEVSISTDGTAEINMGLIDVSLPADAQEQASDN